MVRYHEFIDFSKGRLRAAIFESAETLHLILLCYLGDAIRSAVSADSKMVARNRPLWLGVGDRELCNIMTYHTIRPTYYTKA